MQVVDQDSMLYFGGVNESVPDWREDKALLAESDPDDEVLANTPEEVVVLLGFDPLGELE